jgi:CheY-like chemotaxis protein
MPHTSQRPSVLLVEDSEDDAFFFLRTLRLSDAAGPVTHVADGGLAIQHLEKARAGAGPLPDIIFLDLKIPTFSGFEVLAWIRAQYFAPPLEIAVLSGSEQQADVARALALGAAACYVKPLSVGELKRRCSAWREKSMTGVPLEIAQVASGPNGPA